MPRRAKSVLIAALLGSVSVSALAEPAASNRAEPPRPYVPAVSMEVDRRTAPNDAGTIRTGARSGASGLVRCSGSLGTAQLTLRADIITTAAHVLIGADGEPRASCAFQSTAGGQSVPVDARSIRTGSRTPLSDAATRDWAIARLARPLNGVTPYGLAGRPPGRAACS